MKNNVILSLLILPMLAFSADDNTPETVKSPLEQTYRAFGEQSMLRNMLFKLPLIGEVKSLHDYQNGAQQSQAVNRWFVVRDDLSMGYRWHEQVTLDHSEKQNKYGIVGTATGNVILFEVAPGDVENPDAGYAIPLIINTETTLTNNESTQTLTLKPDEITGLTYGGFTLTHSENKTQHSSKETLQSQAFHYDDEEGGKLTIAPFELGATKREQDWQLELGALKIGTLIDGVPLELRLKSLQVHHKSDKNSTVDDVFFANQLGTTNSVISGLQIDLDDAEAISISSLNNKQTLVPSGDTYTLDTTLEIAPDNDIVGILSGRVGMLIDKASLTLHIDKLDTETLKLFSELQIDKSPRHLRRQLEELVKYSVFRTILNDGKLVANLTLVTDIGQAEAQIKITRNEVFINDIMQSEIMQKILEEAIETGNTSVIEDAGENAVRIEIVANIAPAVSDVIGLSDFLLKAPFKPKIVDGQHVYHAIFSAQKQIVNGEDVTGK